MYIPYTLTPTSLNVLHKGRMRTLHSSHMNFARAVEVVRALSANTPEARFAEEALLTELESILDIKGFIASYTSGRLALGDGSARLDGRDINGYVVGRILAAFKEGFNVDPMARFIEKLYANPTLDVRDDLYKWMENGGLPITEDGDFLAFKKVDEDYRSHHDKSVLHVIGEELKMPREACDDNRNNTCSRGLHFCSYEYLRSYMGEAGHVLILKINPANVVAIPTDYNLTKGRACAYVPIGEVPFDEAQQFFEGRVVVDSFGTYTSASDFDLDEVAYEDDEYYDEYEDTCNVKADTTYAYSAEDFEEATLFAVEIMDIDRLKATIELAKSNGEFMLAYDLEEAFSWNTTPQGDAFWQDVSVDTLKLAEADIKWLETLYAFSTKDVGVPISPSDEALIDAAWDTHKDAGMLVPVEGVERIDLECLRAVIEGYAGHLWNAFFWASAVQGETFWRDRATERVAITDADRKWLTRLYEHEQAKAKACPSWVDAMRKDPQA